MQNPNANFDLSRWKLTLPVDLKGGTTGVAAEVTDFSKLVPNPYFHFEPTGELLFSAMADGATTKGSNYARSELREMDGDKKAAWQLDQGGTMTATLKVNEVPKFSDGDPGRMIVGQIHGSDDELVRLYYQDGGVYFMNDQAGKDNKETKFTFHNEAGEQPAISLGETFSYKIDVRGNTLTVTVYADGKTFTSTSAVNSVWQDDHFYFKAGAYLGVNESNGSGKGEAAFFGLDFGHTPGSGLLGLLTGTKLPDDENLTPDDPALIGTDAADTLAGGSGDDTISGGGGNDTISGGTGSDRLDGGTGADRMYGGFGNDVYVIDNRSDHAFESRTQGKDLVLTSVSYTLASSIENMTLIGNSDLNGTGNSLANSIVGNSAANVLFGASGNDTLSGGLGKDVLTGGLGKDTFVFDTAISRANVDQITDFDFHADHISLDKTIFAALDEGVLAKWAFASNFTGLATTSNQHVIYEVDTGKLIYDSNGNRAGGITQIALLDANLKLANTDFIIV